MDEVDVNSMMFAHLKSLLLPPMQDQFNIANDTIHPQWNHFQSINTRLTLSQKVTIPIHR
jgi:hypothetical protein